MQLPKILAELETYRGYFPREAVARATEERDRITPHLLQVLNHAAANPESQTGDPDYMAHIYAMFLLAQFREQRAYPLITEFFSHPGDISLDLTGDMVTEDLHRILASVSCGDDSLMKRLVEDSEANEYVRGAALNGLVALVANDEKPRDGVIEYFRSLFRERLPWEPSHVRSALVDCSTDLYPEELYADIERSYKEGLIESFFISLEDVRATLALGKDRTLALLKKNRRYKLVTDTISDMEWWACFRKQTEQAPDRKKRKIGRNQPCPCGSGKKYKKCCGRA